MKRSVRKEIKDIDASFPGSAGAAPRQKAKTRKHSPATKHAGAVMAADEARELFELAPVGLVVVDSSGIIRERNAAAAQFLWQDTSAPPREKIQEWIALLALSAFEDFLHNVFTRPGKHACNTSLLLADSTANDMYCVGVLLKERRHALITFTDWNEHGIIEAAARQSEKKYRKLHASMRDGFVYVHMDGRIVESNAQYRDMLGYTEEELARLTYTDITPAEWHSFEAQIVEEQILRLGYSEVYEKEYVRKNRQRFPVELRTFLIRDEQGNNEGMWAIVRDITDRKNAELLLARSKRALGVLNAHIQDVREEEKKHIAREIHDDLGQRLTALKMDVAWLLSNLKPAGNALEHLKGMRALIDESLLALRQLTRRLRPQILDDLGFFVAVEWQVKDFMQRFGTPCTLHIDSKDVVLENNLSLSLFRIIQEALTNAARHSHATAISIDFTHDRDWIHISIRDNGIGISEKEIASITSFGILGMKERVEHCNGTFLITGKKDSGTTISISVPISKRETQV